MFDRIKNALGLDEKAETHQKVQEIERGISSGPPELRLTKRYVSAKERAQVRNRHNRNRNFNLKVLLKRRKRRGPELTIQQHDALVRKFGRKAADSHGQRIIKREATFAAVMA